MVKCIILSTLSIVTLSFYADDLLNKLQELRRNGHKNVALILRALEHVIIKDEECIHKLVHHGLVVKISMSFYLSKLKLTVTYQYNNLSCFHRLHVELV